MKRVVVLFLSVLFALPVLAQDNGEVIPYKVLELDFRLVPGNRHEFTRKVEARIYSEDKEARIPRKYMASRENADRVLSFFDSIPGRKLLYSRQDSRYYIYIQADDATSIRNYYVAFDEKDGSLVTFERVREYAVDKEIERLETMSASRVSRVDRRDLIALPFLKKVRTCLDDAFDSNIYWKGFITDLQLPVETPEADSEEYSYFVLKDETGARHGEFRLPVAKERYLMNHYLYNYAFGYCMWDFGNSYK